MDSKNTPIQSEIINEETEIGFVQFCLEQELSREQQNGFYSFINKFDSKIKQNKYIPDPDGTYPKLKSITLLKSDIAKLWLAYTSDTIPLMLSPSLITTPSWKLFIEACNRINIPANARTAFLSFIETHGKKEKDYTQSSNKDTLINPDTFSTLFKAYLKTVDSKTIKTKKTLPEKETSIPALFKTLADVCNHFAICDEDWIAFGDYVIKQGIEGVDFKYAVSTGGYSMKLYNLNTLKKLAYAFKGIIK
jgi:hypothetical protein